MAKTLVEIDDDVLAAAAAELGTTTKKDTVNAALRLAASRGERAHQKLASVFNYWGEDITDPQVMAQARR